MDETAIYGAKVTATTNMGAGVTRDADGKTVFVSSAAEGDVCDVRITSSKRSFSLGEIERLITPSPYRIGSDCAAYVDGCGGCSFRHVSYEHELDVKKNYIASLLARAGLDTSDFTIRSAGEHESRTKVTLPIGKNGEIGYYRKNSHTPVPCLSCRLHDKTTNKILSELEVILKRVGTSHFHHVCIRRAAYGTMLIFISSDQSDLEAARSVYSELRAKFSEITSAYFCEKQAEEAHGAYTHIGGEEKLRDSLSGCEFLISPDAFYQVNHGSAEILYALSAEYADIKDGEAIADLYCGTGTIGISVIKSSGVSAKLFGIEIVESAVRDARENAEINGVDAEFISCDAAKFDRHADAVIVDPPRAGCDEKLISHLLRILPSRIVYVSCDPATLARDVKKLGEMYKVTKATAVDMFPRTGHVECICLLQRRPDHI